MCGSAIGVASPCTAEAAEVVFALAGWCLWHGRQGMVLGTVLAAHGLLRTGDLLAMVFGQLSWVGDGCRATGSLIH